MESAAKAIAEGDPGWEVRARETFEDHLAKGKGIVIYRNEDLGHPGIGHVVAFTFGTPEAQFEGDESTLPERCPDGLMPQITGGINWRYQKVGVIQPTG